MRAALSHGLARKPPYLFRLLCLLMVGTAVLRLAHFSTLAALAPPPARVPAHQLFETLARAVVAAGAELVLLQGATGGVALATGTYPDGSPERHTVADGSSAAVLRRVSLAFPGLAVVNEEEVAAAAAAAAAAPGAAPGAAGSAARGWRPTQAWRGGGGEGDGSSSGSGRGEGGVDASALRAAALRSPTLPLSELGVFLDPLDATQEYSEGLWDFVTVSACVARCGVPIVGLLYQPFQQRLYWTRPGTGVNVAFSADGAVEAERALAHAWGDEVGGGGACCQQQQQQQRQRQPAAGAAAAEEAPALANATASAGGLRVLLSRSHSSQGSAAALAALLPPSAALLPAGGAGYKFIQVLEGAGEAYVHPGGIRKWDVCAGEALLRAAGGAVAQWDGAAIDYCLPALPGSAQAQAPATRLEGLAASAAAAGGGGGSGAGPGAATSVSARARAMEQAVRVAGLVAARTVALGKALGRLLQPASAPPEKGV
jgi:3'-phosphoadenosine 5'-phosphosulfate (PAPS) 3'-phosphatase